MSSETTIARARAARDRESQVIAEGSLQAERAVAWVRLVTFTLLGVSQLLRKFDGQHVEHDPVKVAVLAAYLVFSVSTLVAVHRATAKVGRAQVSLVFTAIDIGFFLTMSLRTIFEHHPHAMAQTAATFFLPILYAIARYSAVHMALATALSACAFWLVAVLDGTLLWHEIAFVIACYAGGGLLIGATSARIRGLFTRLRRRDNLARFVAPQVVEQLMRFGDLALQPRQVEVTVLFTDIRDFTALSEKMAPRELLELLDGYFSEMAAIVKGVNGTVNKFIGDGLLAVWGAPEQVEEHAVLALKAALHMRARLVELNAERAGRGLVPLRIGMGVHTGLVAAGMLGGADQHEYTVIGDAVNLASRIEGLTKQFGVDILASEATWKRAGDRFAATSLGEARVKGREEPVVVFAIEALRVNGSAGRAAG